MANFPGATSTRPSRKQLAPDRLPGVAFQFLADAVGRELVMPALPDRFRVGAGQHFDDVIEAEGEPALLRAREDAGEKFLRGDRAVEGLARRRGSCRSRCTAR